MGRKRIYSAEVTWREHVAEKEFAVFHNLEYFIMYWNQTMWSDVRPVYRCYFVNDISYSH